tara:strand:+ start:5240 stop:5953 length:714 start_codon:yes stop_codon:yes gene_type:complete
LLEAEAPVVKTMSNIPAYLGSATHELLELCLNNEVPPSTFSSQPLEVYDEEHMEFPYVALVDDNMIRSVKVALDYIEETRRKVKHKEYAELAMRHSKVKGLQGTADYVRVYSDGIADLYDLKNGRSAVQVKNRKGEYNTQLLSYAAMLTDTFPLVKTINLAIISPNINTKSLIRADTIGLSQIKEHIGKVAAVELLANSMTPSTLQQHLKEGSHCWFCSAKGICPSVGMKNVLEAFG